MKRTGCAVKISCCAIEILGMYRRRAATARGFIEVEKRGKVRIRRERAVLILVSGLPHVMI